MSAGLLSLAASAADSSSHHMLQTIFVAITAGIFLLVIAHRFNFPAIVLLLAGGVALGPELLGIVDADGLGDGLEVIVALSIGLILFEGGLTLDVSGYFSSSAMIKRLLTIGVMITWMGATTAVLFVAGMQFDLALLSGSLVIVTGPTVIAPLLKRIKINTKLHSILHWEGVLIDPIGVFVALGCVEWSIAKMGVGQVFFEFSSRVILGILFGMVAGFSISTAIKRKIIPEDLQNIFALAGAVLVFGLAESILKEMGLLAVTVAGFVLGIRRPGNLTDMRRFKAEITDILLGVLFILLASRLEFQQFLDFGIAGYLAVAIVMFAVRPLSIFVCGHGLDISLREKLFLSWVAPRGIVAASLASLITFALEQDGVENAKFIETFTYSVIIGTIVLQGLSAGFIAKLLGVKRPDPTAWLIVGAHPFSWRLAQFLQTVGETRVRLLDANARAVGEARSKGLTAFRADALDPKVQNRAQLMGVGFVIALTDNDELNILVCQRWGPIVGADRVFRWSSTPHNEDNINHAPGRLIWPRLPKPSLLSTEIMRGEVTFYEDDGQAKLPSQAITELFGWTGSRILVDPEQDRDSDQQTVERRLYLRREVDYLLQCLPADLVLKFDDVLTLESLFSRIVDAFAEVEPRIDRAEALDELMKRQREFPTALGQGVAVPHAYINSAPKRVCAVVRVGGDIDFQAPDDEPVRLVFVLLSPPGDPEGHLATIAEIARLMVDPQKRAEFIAADSASEVFAIIRS